MRTFCCVLVAGALACAPGAKAPVNVAVLAYVPKDQKYEPSEEQLTTVTNLAAMSGQVATMLGGAQIVDDPNDPTLMQATTLDEIKAAILKSPGGSVTLDFTSSADPQGQPLYFPTDFDAWNMATAYYDLEQAFTFYENLGLSIADVTPPPNVYYFPTYLIGSGSTQQKQLDNAAYFPLLQSFIILPFVQLQEIPLSMNVGIMSHEYTHSIVDLRVFNHNQILIYSGWPDLASTLMVSLDEGNADLMGTLVTCGADYNTCDTQFIAPSIPTAGAPRDLDGVHCSDPTLETYRQGAALADWRASGNQYVEGTWFSSAVWRGAREFVAKPAPPAPQNLKAIATAAWLWQNNPDFTTPGLAQIVNNSGTTGTGIDWPTVLDSFARQISQTTLRSSVCAAFLDRFRAVLNGVSLPSCVGVKAYTDCP